MNRLLFFVTSDSVSEFETQIIRVNKLYKFEIDSILEKIMTVKMMLNKLIFSLKRRIC